MSTIGKRIMKRRKALGLTQEALAARIGYRSKSTINKIELGINDIPNSKLPVFAEALETTPAWLMGYDVPMRRKREASHIYEDETGCISEEENPVRLQIESYLDTLAPETLAAELDRYRALDGLSDTLPAGKRRLPLLGNVACGEPIYAAEEHEAYAVADADIGADFCLIARGDSMINARIFDGDVLFVRLQESVDDGEIAVVLINDEATVKRVYYDKDNNVVTLIPENPLYKPMRYVGEQLCDIRILGKVVAGQYTI
ncbi:MAG: helix-turn-helix domain-containing protein [Clostridia bacterium]|nr:helix-turn-helix domain-containing protein [Clostridia bacterium]